LSNRLNEDRLSVLEKEKVPFLFSSSHLAEFLEITPSVKTRLSMILMLGPRLTDPRAKVDYFLDLFRFSEEKEKVQGVLKARTTVLKSSSFRQSGLNLQPIGGYGVAADNPVVAKPFMNLKGMAAARERGVKPVSKPIASLSNQPLPQSRSEGDVQKLNEGKNGNTVKNGQIRNSSPNLVSTAASTQVTAKTATLALESVSVTTECKNGDDGFIDIMLNEKKEQQQLQTTLKTLTSVNPFEPIVNISSAIPASSLDSKKLQSNGTNLKVFCPSEEVSPPDSGKAKRIINGHKSTVNGKYSPKFTSMEEGVRMKILESIDRFSPSTEAKSTFSNRNVDTKNGNGHVLPQPSSSTVEYFIHPGPLLVPKSPPFQRRKSSEAILSHSKSRMESLLKDTSSVNVRRISGIIDRSHKGNERSEQTDTSGHNNLNKAIEEELDHFSGSVDSQDQSQNHIKTRLATAAKNVIRSASFNGINSNNSLGICTPRGTPVKIAWIRDKSYYEEMIPEGSVGMDGDIPLFSCKELVRKNYMKEYDGVIQSELEEYMIEEDFLEQFGMTKDDFKKQPIWRQIKAKKSLLLF